MIDQKCKNANKKNEEMKAVGIPVRSLGPLIRNKPEAAPHLSTTCTYYKLYELKHRNKLNHN